MKRLTAILTAAVLCAALCACNGKPAASGDQPAVDSAPGTTEQENGGAPGAQQAERIDFQTQATADLDGDGVYEMIFVDVNNDPVNDAAGVTVTVEKNGEKYVDTVEYRMLSDKFIDTVHGDGTMQIFLVGDLASDDYETLIYRFEDGQLKRASLYGEVQELNHDGTFSVRQYINILGTYGSTCTFGDMGGYTFAPVSDYLVTRYEDFETSRKLTVQTDGLIGYNEAGAVVELPVGTQLLLVSTNLTDRVRCESSLGEDIYLSVFLPEGEWEWRVESVPESEWFGELMYAG